MIWWQSVQHNAVRKDRQNPPFAWTIVPSLAINCFFALSLRPHFVKLSMFVPSRPLTGTTAACLERELPDMFAWEATVW
jgi:hypothetical protein